jgi:hypothetical protein
MRDLGGRRGDKREYASDSSIPFEYTWSISDHFYSIANTSFKVEGSGTKEADRQEEKTGRVN